MFSLFLKGFGPLGFFLKTLQRNLQFWRPPLKRNKCPAPPYKLFGEKLDLPCLGKRNLENSPRP